MPDHLRAVADPPCESRRPSAFQFRGFRIHTHRSRHLRLNPMQRCFRLETVHHCERHLIAGYRALELDPGCWLVAGESPVHGESKAIAVYMPVGNPGIAPSLDEGIARDPPAGHV